MRDAATGKERSYLSLFKEMFIKKIELFKMVAEWRKKVLDQLCFVLARQQNAKHGYQQRLLDSQQEFEEVMNHFTKMKRDLLESGAGRLWV